MAVALGNITPLLDLATRTIIPDRVITRTTPPDRKIRPLPSDVVSNLFWKDPQQSSHFESAFDQSKERHPNRKKSNRSKLNGVEYENFGDDDNGNGGGEVGDGDGGGGIDWESEMRRRVKEIEEMRELEKKAEELQYKADQEDGDGDGDGEQKEETEEEKRMRVKKELQKVAREQAERRKTAQLMFELGQKAYERGTYSRAIEFLEAALTIIPRSTLFGGEIQIWLAMAYDANNRHTDCIALYQQLEKKHPIVGIRRQAKELRYILQAPKLKITQEEMVTIPLIGSSYDSYAATWTDKYKDRDQRLSGSTANQFPSNKDYLENFMVWKPPTGLENNRALWVSLVLGVGLVGAALFLQR